MSVVQVICSSHATSYAILLGKKTLMVASRSPCTRDFQVSSPFVYTEVSSLLLHDPKTEGEGEYAHIIVHVGGAEQEDAVIVRELRFVYVGAVSTNMSTIVDVVVCVHKPDTSDPVPSLLGPVGVGLVAGIAGQSCAEVEEATVRDAWRILALCTSISAAKGNSLFL